MIQIKTNSTPKKPIVRRNIVFTPRLDMAIRAATYAHAKQSRKGMDIPYIVHPYSVMLIASQATNDEDILIACLMHDVLEDVSHRYPEEQMMSEYGIGVVEIVKGVTKNDGIKDWHDRAVDYNNNLLNNAPDGSIVVACSDKIHNMMSTLADYQMQGESLWRKFKAGKDEQLWYYQEVYNVIKSRMPKLNINRQYLELMKEFADISS